MGQIESRIQQVVGLINNGDDETVVELRERLAYIGELLLWALEQDSDEFDERFNQWSKLLNSRHDWIND